mmetsp:Transcript_29969/g.25267  ORF Transcript_29969/g.25267 Transcript_29969/m.25267 type:complete len:229 (-) Transcript_29969:112-798(-)
MVSLQVPFDRSLGRPAVDRMHLMPFLLPTNFCDSENAAIRTLAHELIPAGTSAEEAAKMVRAWVRREITYTLDVKDTTASQTLRSREGMCTNKANLQVAIMRAAGVPAGFVMCHVTKEAFKSEHILEELYATISDPTIHCFCAVYIPEFQSFRNYDATEKSRESPAHNKLLAEDPDTGETTYQPKWLRGPFGPVQANLDHLLSYVFPSRISDQLRDKQNALYRKYKEI